MVTSDWDRAVGEFLRIHAEASGQQSATASPVVKTAVAGRAADCDIRLDDEHVSQHHAAFCLHADGTVTVEDLGTLNGVFVNGLQVYAPTAIGPGSVVRLGRTELPWRQ